MNRPPQATASNAASVRRLYEEGINRDRPEVFAELIADDYVGGSGERGPAGYAENVAGLRAGFPDVRFRVEELVDGGDRVAVRWTWVATHAGPFRGLAPTGRRVTNEGIAIYAFRDGKVVRAHLQTDRLGVLQSLGAAPAPRPLRRGSVFFSSHVPARRRRVVTKVPRRR